MESTTIKKDAMNAIVKMLSKDKTRPALRSIHTTKNGAVVGTDSYKLGVILNGAVGGESTFFPPHTKKYGCEVTIHRDDESKSLGSLDEFGVRYPLEYLDNTITYPKFDKVLERFDDEEVYTTYSETFDIKLLKDVLDSMLAAGEKSVTIHTVINNETNQQEHSGFFTNEGGSVFYMVMPRKCAPKVVLPFNEVIKRVISDVKEV